MRADYVPRERLADSVLALRLSRRFVTDANGCRVWTGVVVSGGYGSAWDGERSVGVHRLAYEVLVGSIPEGLTIDHLCRNKLCISTAHMELVTMRENILRSDGISARNARKTHCPYKHAYDEENTLWYTPPGKRARRMCLTCKRTRDRERWRRLARARALVSEPAAEA